MHSKLRQSCCSFHIYHHSNAYHSYMYTLHLKNHINQTMQIINLWHYFWILHFKFDITCICTIQRDHQNKWARKWNRDCHPNRSLQTYHLFYQLVKYNKLRFFFKLLGLQIEKIVAINHIMHILINYYIFFWKMCKNSLN